MSAFRYIPIFILCIALPISCLASPFLPQNDDEILEYVDKQTSKDLIELSRLADQVRKSPQNIDISLQLFNKYLDQARKTGDPFYSGMAEATLEKWLKEKNISHSVRLARATLKQYNHDFISALNDTNQILKEKPSHVQARLLRANIFRIQGKYAKAREDCFSLALLTDPVIVTICGLSVSSLTGKAKWSADKLVSILKNRSSSLAMETSNWATIVLSEILSSSGQNKKALAYLKDKMQQESKVDIYVKSTFMDILLLEKKYQEAYKFASDQKLPDALLLRKAIAAKKNNLPDAEKLAAVLKSRFKDSSKSGRPRHLREEALFELHLNQNAERALNLSLENWQNQREPLDTRTVLEAALNAGKPNAALPVVNWIKKQGTEDIYIRQMISKVMEKL